MTNFPTIDHMIGSISVHTSYVIVTVINNSMKFDIASEVKLFQKSKTGTQHLFLVNNTKPGKSMGLIIIKYLTHSIRGWKHLCNQNGQFLKLKESARKVWI